MITVEANFIDTYIEAVSTTFVAFLPLFGATVGIFLAFAIANMLRYFIQKTATRVR